KPWRSDITGGLGVYGLRNQPENWRVFFNWSTAHDHADKLMCIRIYANFKGIAGSFERSFADVTGRLFAWSLVGKVDLERQNSLIHILTTRTNSGCNPSVVARCEDRKLMLLGGHQDGVPQVFCRLGRIIGIDFGPLFAGETGL